METVYRSKRYSFLIPSKKNENKYLRDTDKTEIGKRIYKMAKDGYECVYPVRKVVNTERIHTTGEIDETDCFYETEMKKVN
ncbi:hypothetical protein OCE50_27820 [Bacillus wiedmannii]|uniref:Uncharacterized protein n=1 Tax=Bacillus thuringiensis TaxID=1428 RepID=A0A4R4BKP1_BACTU|nr:MULTISPECIES: hypothetical protein [Bacillus cereus group]MCU5414676.1 hypothetical protein [Bacillus wiedmannii]TCW59049.1 hypothetical protein EC917_101303 [Bacillus thuringiensis]TCW59711.1 hypothetical protein EC910_101341 [Bacillus thuringiensis]